MREAVLVVGPESSGTKMLTEAFVRCDYFGDGGFRQRMDDLQFVERPDKIVFRQSLPHGAQWPDLIAIVSAMQTAGYVVRPVLVFRDKDCCRQSQGINQGHSPEASTRNIPKALDQAFTELTAVGLWPLTVYLGAFVKSALVRSAFFSMFGLTVPKMEFVDPDEKYKSRPAWNSWPKCDEVAYFGRLDGRNIGESLPLMSHSIIAERLGIPVYWILDTAADRLFHAELFRLYARAGVFRNIVLCASRDGEPEAGDGPILGYVRRVYCRRYAKMLPLSAATGIEARAVPVVAELRARFSFLGRWDMRPYVTCHPASFANLSREATIENLIRHLRPAIRQHSVLYLMGLPSERPVASLLEAAVVDEFPDVEVVNTAGHTDLESFFRLLYGSQHHVCAETCSGLFTCQIGIPTVHLLQFVGEGLDPMRFAKWFADVPAYRGEVDLLKDGGDS